MRIIAALACLAFCVPALADTECLPLPEAKARATELSSKYGGEWTFLDHAATQIFMDVMNAQPPETDITADEIIVVEMREVGFAIIARREACGFKPIGRLSIRATKKALEAARGNAT